MQGGGGTSHCYINPLLLELIQQQALLDSSRSSSLSALLTAFFLCWQLNGITICPCVCIPRFSAAVFWKKSAGNMWVNVVGSWNLAFWWGLMWTQTQKNPNWFKKVYKLCFLALNVWVAPTSFFRDARNCIYLWIFFCKQSLLRTLYFWYIFRIFLGSLSHIRLSS